MFDEQLLSRQQKDRITIDMVNNQGEQSIKTVDLWSVLEKPDLFVFIADEIPFVVAGNKSECLKRKLLFKKPAVFVMAVLMIATILQTIYTIQVAEVFFFAFKRSDVVPHLMGLLYVAPFVYVASSMRISYYSIRESSRYPNLWLPSTSEHTIEDLLNPETTEPLYFLQEILNYERNTEHTTK